MSSKLEIKNRIKTVGSIQKITKAMKLVASAKLAKQRTKMEQSRVYSTYLKEMMESIVAQVNTNHIFLSKHEGKTLYIVITSDMGLCGGYNGNIFRKSNHFDRESELIIIGQRGAAWGKANQLNVVENYANLKDDCYYELALLMKDVLKKYTEKVYGSIKIVYTKFINTVTYETEIKQLLPIDKSSTQIFLRKEMLFEPSQEEILDILVPMYINASVYSCFLESKTSEHAARRTAMESATDNASELQEKLELQYNQARQAAITQEISEIVGGADAL